MHHLVFEATASSYGASMDYGARRSCRPWARYQGGNVDKTETLEM